MNGLRGLAALVVVLHHFAYVFLVFATRGAGAKHFEMERVVYSGPLQLLVAGNFAVCIFFILSGFVLSNAFFQTGDVRVVQSGALKRYFRLMPPILASVLVSWAILQLGLNFNHGAAGISGSPWLNNFWPRAVSFGEAVFYGAYDIIAGSGSAGLLNNALWTMKIEFFGSMLVFAFLALFGRLRVRWLIYLVMMGAFWNTYYLAFLLGIALCDYRSRRQSPVALPWPLVAAMVIAGLWLGAAPIPGPTATIYDMLAWPGADRTVVLVLTHIVGSALLLGALVYSPALKKVLASRPLAYLGKVSFSMYLLHVLVLGSLISYLSTALMVSHSYGLSLMICGAVYLVFVLAVADIFTRWVDIPSIRLAGVIQRQLMVSRRPPAPKEPAKEPERSAGLTAPSAGIN